MIQRGERNNEISKEEILESIDTRYRRIVIRIIHTN